MSLLRFFRRGDQLTADRLNELVQAVEPTTDLQNKPATRRSYESNLVTIRNNTGSDIKVYTACSVGGIYNTDGLSVDAILSRMRNSGIVLNAGFATSNNRTVITLEAIKKGEFGRALYLGGPLFCAVIRGLTASDWTGQNRLIRQNDGTWKWDKDVPGFGWIASHTVEHRDTTPWTYDMFFVVDGSLIPGLGTNTLDLTHYLTSASLVYGQRGSYAFDAETLEIKLQKYTNKTGIYTTPPAHQGGGSYHVEIWQDPFPAPWPTSTPEQWQFVIEFDKPWVGGQSYISGISLSYGQDEITYANGSVTL